MPDITMCDNAHCERRDTCYRWRAIPTLPVQSWGEFEGGNYCHGFLPIGHVPAHLLREIIADA